jgi:nucleotide-binding universal stress UspA family protein
MKMFDRIVVAVDGSPTSNRGLKTAIDLAKSHGATLHAIHVVDDMVIAQGAAGMNSGGYVPPQFVDEWLTQLREAGRHILRDAERIAQSRGYHLQSVLIETLGQGVAHVILKQVRRLRADLIVMGTHGRRGLRRVVMGSDAETVVREARVPVLLVRSPLKASSSSRRSGSTRSRPALSSSRNRTVSTRPAADA